MPSEPSSRVSRVTIRSKFSSVNLRDRQRAAHVGEREDDVDDDRRDEEHGNSRSAGPRNRREVGALAAQLGAREVGHGEIVAGRGRGKRPLRSLSRSVRDRRSVLDHDVLAELVCSSSTTKSAAACAVRRPVSTPWMPLKRIALY